MVSAPRCPPGARGLLALLLLLLPLPGARGRCGSPPKFSFAEVPRGVRSSYPVGYRLRYSCRQGYTLDPQKSPVVTCGADSTWLIDPEFCVGRPCKPLELENGRVDLTDLRFGATATFSCNEGYKIIGPTSAQCVIAGNGVDWDKEVPLCQEIRCSSPDITNGKAIPRKETYMYEDKIRIECNSGYALKNKNGLIKCEHNRAWHPPLPICEPACEPPARIANGRDDRGLKDVFLVGSSVTYECDRGWSLVGVSSIQCTAGYWGTPRWNAPVPKCKACEPPARIANGRDDRGSKDVFLVGSSVTYECDRGWSLVGVSSIRCTAGYWGTPRWDASVPECKESLRCPNPVIEHGEQVSEYTEYTVGNHVEFQCESGYILKGSKSTQCQANGTWDPPVPSCIKVGCPKPDVQNEGMVSASDEKKWYNMNESITFTCSPGYQFSDLWYQSTTDSLTITCSADGTWPVLPKCEKQINSPLCNMVRETVQILHCGLSLAELRTRLEAQKLYLEIQKLKRDLQKYKE